MLAVFMDWLCLLALLSVVRVWVRVRAFFAVMLKYACLLVVLVLA